MDLNYRKEYDNLIDFKTKKRLLIELPWYLSRNTTVKTKTVQNKKELELYHATSLEF